MAAKAKVLKTVMKSTCPPRHPDADKAMLMMNGIWDAKLKKWVPKPKPAAPKANKKMGRPNITMRYKKRQAGSESAGADAGAVKRRPAAQESAEVDTGGSITSVIASKHQAILDTAWEDLSEEDKKKVPHDYYYQHYCYNYIIICIIIIGRTHVIFVDIIISITPD